jgi:hypothetical protein
LDQVSVSEKRTTILEKYLQQSRYNNKVRLNLKDSLPTFHLRLVALAMLRTKTFPSFNFNGTLLASGEDRAVQTWDLADRGYTWGQILMGELLCLGTGRESEAAKTVSV